MLKQKTNKRKEIVRETLIATVDIGMVSNKGYWETPDGRNCKPFSFSNNREGFRKFWSAIVYARDLFKLRKVIVGFESTGPYGEPLLHYLLRKGVELVQVNPMHTKRFKEIQDNTPLKSDDKDPMVIASLIRCSHFLSVMIPTGGSAKLRRLTNEREGYIKDRTALFNQLQQLVFLIFPEFGQVIKDIKSKTAMYLMKKYTDPETIGGLSIKILTEELKEVSKGKFGLKKAEALIKLARSTVGIKEGVDVLTQEIRRKLSMIEMLNEYISAIEQDMEKVLKRIPVSSIIFSIKRLGVVTAAGIIGEVGNFGKFGTQSALLKHAGLNLYETSSGKHIGVRRITKRGRSLLRKLLYYASINLVRKGGIMHTYYERLVNTNGMMKKKALIAVSRKLLCLIYALVRDNSEYMEDYHGNKLPMKAA